MKILIVEDDPIHRTLLKELLAEYGTCDTAKNGKIALTSFSENLKTGVPYDLVCLDIMIPKLSGQEVLQGIKKVQTEEGIKEEKMCKVIMVSALDDKDSILGSFVRGCEGYIVKPATAEKLLNELKDLGLV
jgi:two-component system chemotaxis response regulator CheY